MSILVGTSMAGVTAALGALLLRSIVRLDLAWDVFTYHLPFAALRGGIRITHQFSDLLRTRLDGFPPLPHFIQGALWRLTGSVNATGVVGMLALLLFIAYCQVVLRASWWLVAAVALSAPLVIIHAASSYVDLFSNAFLAVGAASVLCAVAYPERANARLLTAAAAAIAGATWSKYQMVPAASLIWVSLAFVFLRPAAAVAVGRKRAAQILSGGLLLAGVPYLVNLARFGNPFWPVRVPLLEDLLPWIEDPRFSRIYSRPQSLAGASQVSLFFRSLLEVGLPTSYPDRPRWVIDQGITAAHLRLGGFWWVSVVASLAALTFMAVRLDRRRGLALVGGLFAGIGFVSFLPQSHELRYYLFLPLTWAAAIGFLFPEFRVRFPRSAAAVVLICTSLFGTMAWVNRDYYRPERIGWVQAAEALGAARYWPGLSRTGVNCAIRMAPRPILLTGPSMTEYRVREEAIEELCADGSTVVTPEGIRPLMARATTLQGSGPTEASRPEKELIARRALVSSLAHLEAGRFVLASERAGQAATLCPTWQGPYRIVCSARNALGEYQDALYACVSALTLGIDDEFSRQGLATALSAGKDAGTRPDAFRDTREWLDLSEVRYREQRFEDSIEAAARVLRREPGSAEAWERVAEGSGAAGHAEDSARARRIALDLRSHAPTPH